MIDVLTDMSRAPREDGQVLQVDRDGAGGGGEGAAGAARCG
jgi:hypothetical protein